MMADGCACGIYPQWAGTRPHSWSCTWPLRINRPWRRVSSPRRMKQV